MTSRAMSEDYGQGRLGRFLGRSSDPRRGRRLLRAVAFGLGAAIPVTAAAYLVRTKWTPLIDFDERVIRATTDVTRAHPAFRQFLIGWENSTTPKIIFAVGTLTCLYVAWRHPKLRSRALWALITMMVGWNVQLDIKYIVQRARPLVDHPVWTAPGYSFPSGHAATNAVFATSMVLLLWPLLRPAWRKVLLGVAVAHILVTGLDRIFLGVHYPSDVTAGIVLGVGLVIASYAGYLGWRPSKDSDLPPPEGHSGPEK